MPERPRVTSRAVRRAGPPAPTKPPIKAPIPPLKSPVAPGKRPAPPAKPPAAPPPAGRRGRRKPSPIATSPAPLVESLLRGPVAGPIRIVFLDVDGTLTDGTIGFDRHGDSRQFWIRDGIALEWARRYGVLPVALSGRDSLAVRARLEDLKVEAHLGLRDKVAVAERILSREKVVWSQCVMVGDDLPDVPVMKRVGWPIAVANAAGEVKSIARTITGCDGGRGAVREVIEMVLRHNGTWERVLKRYKVR